VIKLQTKVLVLEMEVRKLKDQCMADAQPQAALATAQDKSYLKYCLYFKTAFGRDAATAEVVKGLKSAVAKNLLSAEEKVSGTYIKDANSDWAAIRLLFAVSGEKALRFKKLMKDQILALGDTSVTTRQPSNVFLYSKEARHDFSCAIKTICEDKKPEKK
jgi:hypothetical protein